MKMIILINSQEYIVEDEEAENIKKAIAQGLRFINLRSGEMLNILSISTIGELKKIPFWSIYPVYTSSSGANYIIRDGERVYLDPRNIEEIQYKTDENFAKLQTNQNKRIETS